MSDYHFPDPLDADTALGRGYSVFTRVIFDGQHRSDCVAASVSGGWVEIHEWVPGSDCYSRKRISGRVELEPEPGTLDFILEMLRLPLGHPERAAFDGEEA